ncbi:MAG: CARDB domain-containing protein [Cyanobacteriota bacterium]
MAKLSSLELQSMPAITNTRTIAALNATATGTLDRSDPLVSGVSAYYYEDYLITGVIAGRPIRLWVESSEVSPCLEVFNATTLERVTGSERDKDYLSFMPAAGASYVVRVSSTAESPKTGAYTLHTTPLFSPPLSGTIAAGNGLVTSRLDVNDSKDPITRKYSEDYEITGASSGVPLRLSLKSGFDACLEIINKATMEVIGFDDEGDANGNSLYSFVPTSGITYIARATSYTSEATGNFELRCEPSSSTVDLQMLSASAPTTASVGSLVTMSWTVKNSGSATIPGNWNDSIFLSSDQLIDGHDIELSWESSSSQRPAPNATYSNTVSATLPGVEAPGQYFLIFATDGPGWLGESNENNNQLAIPITLDFNGPDLQVMSASAPSSGSMGQVINVSWTVKNVGQTTAVNSNWHDDIYLSTDRIYSYSDVLIPNPNPSDITQLAAGASYAMNTSIPIPYIYAPGQYYLLIRTNPDLYAGEISKGNNDFAIPITLDLNGPDLQITAASAPSSVSIGQEFNLSWTGKNTGSVSANSPWTDSIYLSSDATYDSSDRFINFLGASSYSPLAPGSTYTQNQRISIPYTTSPGQYHLILLGDSFSVQIESNDFNNSYSMPLTVTASSPSLPVITLTVSPETVTEDGPANLTYTFNRTGTTSSSLAVSFNVGGSASWNNSDYTQQGASDFSITSGVVTFASGSSTATVTIDPTPDPDTEADESIVLTLSPGAGYTIITPSAATGIILNDDTYSSIDSQGNTKLLRRSDGQAFVEIGSTRQQVTAPWGVSVGDDTTGFRMLAAETIAGTNTVLFRHNATNLLHTWSLDANWGWAASNGYTDPASGAGLALLSIFGMG